VPKIRVSTAELAKVFVIWLIVIGQRRADILRDLWTRRGDEHDAAKIMRARGELARELSERLALANWDVMREETTQDIIRAKAQLTED
jgi:hypothetical protein